MQASASDSPRAQHSTRTEWGSNRRFRWHCSCGASGKKSYEMKSIAARAGWAHELQLNRAPA